MLTENFCRISRSFGSAMRPRIAFKPLDRSQKRREDASHSKSTPCKTLPRLASVAFLTHRRDAHQQMLAKCSIHALFQAPQRVFEITPLVPGSPSLDVRSRSPGGTRRWNFDFRFAIADLLSNYASNQKSKFDNRKLSYAHPLRSF